jgi:hypothetical protein
MGAPLLGAASSLERRRLVARATQVVFRVIARGIPGKSPARIADNNGDPTKEKPMTSKVFVDARLRPAEQRRNFDPHQPGSLA